MTQTTLREYLRTTEDAISSGRIDEAMANCQNILAYFPEALEAQRLLGEVYLAQGNLQEAQQIFEWVLTNDPENVIVYCDRALISERTSDIDTALDCYQQAYELSRGNANIRQEFNQLSARVGQQEFMFSRAGLARLYMRGDLLTQAIQEWDAVLAISPERLDARLGLMETYWREGMYEKAEAIATHLLEELPTCLKALLFLAHMTSISNLQRARELLQRAASLDPDLTMAQEIFADLTARQPNDPFLELIKREPILLEDGVPINLPMATPPAPTPRQSAPLSLNTERSAPASPAPWDQQTTGMPASSAGSSPPETSARANWNNHATEGPEARGRGSSESEPPPWQAQLEQSSSQSEQPWYQNDQLTATKTASGQNWTYLENSGSADVGWSDESQEEEQITHPAWLDTLTRSEQQSEQSAAAESAPLPVAQSDTASASTEARSQAEARPAKFEEEPVPFFFSSDDENEMGWPEWLKSLGAETLEPEQSTSSGPLPEIDSTPVRPVAEAYSWDEFQQREVSQSAAEGDPWAALPAMSAKNEANIQPEWMQQISPGEHTPEQNATPDWVQQFAAREDASSQSAAPDWTQQMASAENQPYQAPAAEQEQHYIASLEDLERDLQSQGFVPLAPGSLAAIAQNQQEPQAQAQPQPQAPQQPETALSSALAQLGNFSQSPAAPTSNEPWWNDLNQETGKQPTPARAQPSPSGEPVNPFAALGARVNETGPQPFSPLPATPTPLPSAQPLPAEAARGASAEPASAYRADALLDSDLEMTMRRPAIALQPAQAGAAPGDRPYINGRGYERRHFEHTDDGTLSNHERLVKGYQYQLSGAYEDAMQEYRIIVRNAPELLDDVISNLRALLKITPNFSLGYRVLGDAYMRKGEYLQAMESYNKALTMAKKARN